MRVTCIAASTINHLLKTQALVNRHARKDTFETSLEQAIEEVYKELGIDEDWPNSPPAASSSAPLSLNPPSR